MTAPFPVLVQVYKSGGVKLVLWTQTSPLIEIMPSWKCFPHMSEMSTLAYKCITMPTALL